MGRCALKLPFRLKRSCQMKITRNPSIWKWIVAGFGLLFPVSGGYPWLGAVLSLFLAGFPTGLTGAAVASHLLRYPYLTDLVGPYATVNFATDQSATAAAVKWGQVGVDPSCTAHGVTATRTSFRMVPPNVAAVDAYQWKAQLALPLGSQICYRVYLGANPEIDLLGSDPSPAFLTQAVPGSTDPYSFLVFGDWGGVDLNGANPYQAALMSSMAAQNARFALTVGDNMYSTTGAASTSDQTRYGDIVHTGANTSAVFGSQFWKVVGAQTAIFPAAGNHGLFSGDANNPHLLNWPQDRVVSLSGGRYVVDAFPTVSLPSAWYAFDAGIARFYVLEAAWPNSKTISGDIYTDDYNNHWAPGSAEVQWLEADLAAHPGGLKFAFFHFPMYSDNATENSDTWLQGSNSLEGLLAAHGVQIGFSGHAHVYERNLKPKANSLITYITGGGGAALEPINSCSAFDAYAIGWSGSGGSACNRQPPTDIQQVHHYLLVTVNGTSVTVTPMNALGQSFDQQTYNFSSSAETTAPAVPGNLRLVSSSGTSAHLAWNASSDQTGVRGYGIYRNNALIATVDGSTLAYTDTGLVSGTSTTYQVDAFDGWGNHSGKSNPVTTGQPAPSPTPTRTPQPTPTVGAPPGGKAKLFLPGRHPLGRVRQLR